MLKYVKNLLITLSLCVCIAVIAQKPIVTDIYYALYYNAGDNTKSNVDAMKKAMKVYGLGYAGLFSLNAIPATKMGSDVQKEFLTTANPFQKRLLTGFGEANPIRISNVLAAKSLAKTIPYTLPVVLVSSLIHNRFAL